MIFCLGDRWYPSDDVLESVQADLEKEIFNTAMLVLDILAKIEDLLDREKE